MESSKDDWKDQVRCQDYVIKDGQFIGQFEQVYKQFPDPWGQLSADSSMAQAITIQALKKSGVVNVLEIGCGLGKQTEALRRAGFNPLGVDVSETAITRARRAHPECRFIAGSALDFDIYRRHKPEAIIMSQVTWYLLDQLDGLLAFFRSELKGVLLIHFLATYAPGAQKYGADRFTSLEGILRYFGLNYIEWAEFGGSAGSNTYFLARL